MSSAALVLEMKTAPVALFTEKTGASAKLLLPAAGPSEKLGTSPKSWSSASTVPTTVPVGEFMPALKRYSDDENHGASFTFSTLSVHVAVAESGAPSMPASVTRAWTEKLDVVSKSKEKAEVACAV